MKNGSTSHELLLFLLVVFAGLILMGAFSHIPFLNWTNHPKQTAGTTEIHALPQEVTH